MRFKTGTYVKSKLRTKEFPLIVLVIDDDNPSEYMFNGVIIYSDNENSFDTNTEQLKEFCEFILDSIKK